tara:strand:+ start:4378 stop:4758 length:381 start_codon:yes stop_codon:yes gene_type:complete
MGFTQREIFIQIMTVMVVSSVAKSIPRELRQQILMVMRNSICPEVDNKQWSKIASDINTNNKKILEHLADSLKASGDSDKVMSDPALLALDRTVHDNLKDIDFDKLDMTDAPQEVIDWIKSKKDSV